MGWQRARSRTRPPAPGARCLRLRVDVRVVEDNGGTCVNVFRLHEARNARLTVRSRREPHSARTGRLHPARITDRFEKPAPANLIAVHGCQESSWSPAPVHRDRLAPQRMLRTNPPGNQSDCGRRGPRRSIDPNRSPVPPSQALRISPRQHSRTTRAVCLQGIVPGTPKIVARGPSCDAVQGKTTRRPSIGHTTSRRTEESIQ